MTGLQLQKELNNICEKLSAELLSLTGSTDQVVIDSTDIPAHEKPSGESTTGASFGHRTASTGESEMFYGYKLHLAAVNTSAGPVPVAARVAPANCSDVDEEIVPKLMKEACDFHETALGYKPSYYLMDAGYDADQDNIVFLDYARDCVGEHRSWIASIIAITPLDNPNILQKVDWLVRYHRFIENGDPYYLGDGMNMPKYKKMEIK